MFHLKKFLKYALIMGLVDALPILITAMNNATGISDMDWVGSADRAGLVFIKAAAAGALGILFNLSQKKKSAQVIKPVTHAEGGE